MASADLIPQPHDVLASDAERERVADALRAHATAGRLDADELEQRLERAYTARVRGELAPLIADLPAPDRRPEPPPRRRELPDWSGLVAVAILLVAIWALTGAGYFWPVWPIGGMALHALKHGGRAYGRPPRHPRLRTGDPATTRPVSG